MRSWQNLASLVLFGSVRDRAEGQGWSQLRELPVVRGGQVGGEEEEEDCRINWEASECEVWIAHSGLFQIRVSP